MFRRRLVYAIQNTFEIALDDVQRGTKLVCYVGGKVAALFVDTLKLGDHPVKRAC